LSSKVKRSAIGAASLSQSRRLVGQPLRYFGPAARQFDIGAAVESFREFSG